MYLASVHERLVIEETRNTFETLIFILKNLSIFNGAKTFNYKHRRFALCVLWLTETRDHKMPFLIRKKLKN